jgi:hypothetical protein
VQPPPELPEPPSACRSKRLLAPAPEILPDWMQGEEGARRVLLIIIGAGVAALRVDQSVRYWRR